MTNTEEDTFKALKKKTDTEVGFVLAEMVRSNQEVFGTDDHGRVILTLIARNKLEGMGWTEEEFLKIFRK